MPKPRSEQVSLEATPFYHCIVRCVRRSFLCGRDAHSGKNFDHRKDWLVERLKTLSAVFAVDICAYAILSNHFHLVLRIDHERARGWDEGEVIRRWGRVFPSTVQGLELLSENVRKQRISLWRQRLWDLSWLMRSLNESIARRANCEDRCTGRFWEGRFRSQALLDEGALLTCMSYVDLNPIRAAMADTIEEAEFTSIRERLLAAAGGTQPQDLMPFEQDRPSSPLAEPLPMRLEDYVELLRAAAPTLREPHNEPLPGNLSPALTRLGLDPSNFVAGVREYSRSFFTMVGHVQRIELESKRRGHRRRLGMKAARRLYRSVAA